MTQMIQWHRKKYSTNIVVYPEDPTVLRELQEKLLWLFPDAKPLDAYRFPAMICQKSPSEAGAIKPPAETYPPHRPALFQAESLIVQENHLLIVFRSATLNAYVQLKDLLRSLHAEPANTLIMPLVWLPSRCLFPDILLDKIQEIIREYTLEITVDLQKPEALPAAQWQKQWGNAFGTPGKLTLEQLYPGLEYEMIGNDRDCPETMPYFHVPRGYLYSTDTNPEALYSDEEASILVPYGILKMVDPAADPPKGTCYYWYSSGEED